MRPHHTIILKFDLHTALAKTSPLPVQIPETSAPLGTPFTSQGNLAQESMFPSSIWGHTASKWGSWQTEGFSSLPPSHERKLSLTHVYLMELE